MTGLKVLEVNVHIQGVHPRNEKEKIKELDSVEEKNEVESETEE